MRIKSYNFFSAGVGLEPAIPDKEGECAKRIAIGDGNSIARPQSSIRSVGYNARVHGGSMDTMPDSG